MIGIVWKLFARIIAHPRIAQEVINYAMRTPDMHLPGYMERYWLFNPYNRKTGRMRWPSIPVSIRIHHILREDRGRHPHDHPFDARTILLRGFYIETRNGEGFFRQPGDTATIDFGEYHHINRVSRKGVWTLFIMGRRKGVWGFLVDGAKIPYTSYDQQP
jgi:hypothetical protein